ncbi:MAG: hypothetical protein ACR2MO_03830 [Acidimicrobiales bacterium]
MDWSKVDAALAGALSDAGDTGGRMLPVFVHVDEELADASLLAELDVQTAGGGVRTGTVSAAGVDHLTDQPWVTRVQLSGPLRLLGDH